MRDGDHPSEAAQHEFVDGRSTLDERASIERHLDTCRVCARRVEALMAVRKLLVIEADREAGPDAAFEARLREALDREDAAQAGATARSRGARWTAIVSFAAAATFALLWLGPLRGARPPDLASAAFADASAARRGALDLALRTSDAEALARFHGDRGISFPSRVLDLAMMGWTLEGGSTGPFADRPSALAFYRDAAARWLVCRMFQGSLAELPAPDDRFDASGFTFQVYRRDGATAVFWLEGDVLCVLVSERPEAEVRALAVAKAMLPG